MLNPVKEHDQNPDVASPVLRLQSKPDEAFTLIDMTPAYGEKGVEKAQRGIALREKRSLVVVQDEVTMEQPAELWWFMHTPAEGNISADGRTVVLTQGDGRLYCVILSPAKGRFEMMDAKPLPTSPDPEDQAPNPGVRKLAIHLSGVSSLRLCVALVPLSEEQPPPEQLPPVKPLEEW